VSGLGSQPLVYRCGCGRQAGPPMRDDTVRCDLAGWSTLDRAPRAALAWAIAPSWVWRRRVWRGRLGLARGAGVRQR